jgi:photosystem II stability/assembly factor-like uncharacterized protein
LLLAGLPAQDEPGRPQVVAPRSGSWTAIGLGGGGAMFTPAISPADPRRILLSCDMSGVYRSEDSGKSWELVHYRQLSNATRVRPLWHPTDPNVAFAAGGSAQDLRMSRDGGKTWSAVAGAPARASAIGIDPGLPELILLGSDHGVFRTTDGGKSWAAAHGIRGRALGFHFDQTSPAERRTVFAATDTTLLRSDDGGATWRELELPFQSSPILSFAAGSQNKSRTCILYCSIGSRGERRGSLNAAGIYRSEDRGMTWIRPTAQAFEPRPSGRNAPDSQAVRYDFLVTSDAMPTRVYASDGREGHVVRSDDSGATWRDILFPNMKAREFNVSPNYLIDEPGTGGDVISGLGINPVDPDNLIVADWMDAYITRDGGKTWESCHTRSAERPGRRGSGMRWLNTGLVVTTVWHYYLDPFEPNRHYIAYTDIGYARSTDAGKTWYWQTGRPVRNTTYELAFDPETPGKIWAALADLHDIPQENVISGRHYAARASGGVGLSTDFGVTWQESSQGLARKPITSVIVDPRSPRSSRTLYASAFEDGVYKSIDGGKSWRKTSNGLGAPGVNMRACRLILHADGTLFSLVTALRQNGRYVAAGPGLYRSTDGAQSWTLVNRSRPLLWPKDFDVDPRDSRVIYLGAADAVDGAGGLYKTTDGGSSWARVARKGGDCFGATVHPRKPDWVYLCIAEGETDAGLWLSKDAGKTWRALGDMPFRNAQRITFDPSDDSTIYVATFGGGVWRGPAD